MENSDQVYRRRFADFLRVAVGAMFLLSAVSKLLPAQSFALLLIDQGIAPASLAPYLARGVVALELLLGAALLFRRGFRKATAPSAAALLVVFCLHLAYGILSGTASENCGCFGEVLPMSSAAALIKNIVALGALAYSYVNTEDETPTPLWIPAAAYVALFGAVLLAFPPGLRSAAPDAVAEEFAATPPFADGRVEIADGELIVGVFSLACEECMAIARAVGETRGDVPLFGLVFGDPADAPKFFEEAGGEFPHAFLQPDQFFSLLNTAPPRVVYFRDGEAIGDWDARTFTKEKLAGALE
jgi:hypothetical protein